MSFFYRTNCLIFFLSFSLSLFAEEPTNTKKVENPGSKLSNEETKGRRIQIQNDSIFEPPLQKQTPEPDKDFSLKKENGAKYFTFYPGVQANLTDLTIVSSTGSRAVMMDDQRMDQNLSFLYDLKSQEWQMGDSWGLFILNRNVNFRQSKQKITDITATNMSSSEGESGSSNRSSPIKQYKNQDLGTETYGSYHMLLPAIYYGKKGNDKFRIGLGLGYSKVNIQGTADFNDGNGYFANLMVFSGGRNLDERIDNIGRYSLLNNGNIDGDPYRAYLLSNLSYGNNLEALGAYTLIKGDVNPKTINPLLALYYAQTTGNNLSPLELYALLTLGIGRVNSSTNYAKSFYFFWEIPIGSINWRLGLGGPFYAQNGYKISFSTVEMSFYMPIEF
ncbi:hypothetical protein EHQ16_05795 [Leptospira kanakyensis]|uniref:Porin n=1 Tax=Leptospira kanakyensis TaxID=2484968 RepID=A0A6N4QDQ5_9LEPT|nr:hypothetical protein EHQ11_12225 [Leptospira kanakyensis]TGK64398.1 hypothetical protein EHQ16_05795 [Leptospira kanakyensis]TGK69986.1 hypothetical protein EHQ18_12385 [Leptospira kanakyensis]